MRILQLTGGAGEMYCGSCLRDNALAAELLARGHDVVLLPVYTPTRTDEENVSRRQVFFNGISVYLEQHSAVFRHTPAFVDRLWDAEWVLRLATKRRIAVDPGHLGELTVSMLRGEQGYQRKEIRKLVGWLRHEPRFDIVNLPFSLLLGLAEPLARTLRAPICCTLQGEDLFLDGLGEPYRSEALRLIAESARHVDVFMPVSRFYLDRAPEYFGLPRDRMRLAPLGINLSGYSARARADNATFNVGFFARIAPEKGLHLLSEAYRRLRARCGVSPSRLLVAGYLAPEHRLYLQDIVSALRNAGLAEEFEYRGELDRSQKIAFFHDLDVMSVPATYDEPKGIFLLEAMANGVPVVQPRRGAFTEIVETTGGGVLVHPDDPDAIADGIHDLWSDPARRASLAAAGFQGVRDHYSVAVMAEAVEAVYRDIKKF